MSWRHTTWARWLGWTLAFWVVLWGAVLLSESVSPRYGDLWILALTSAAALLAGARMRSWWWPLGPPAAVLAALLVVEWDLARMVAEGLIGAEEWASRWSTRFWFAIGRAEAVVVAALAAVQAAAGVWWGKRWAAAGRTG